MPNWTTNHLHITGPKEQRDAFLEAIKRGENPMSFQEIKPMPETLNIVDGSDMHLAIWAAIRVEHNVPVATIEYKNICGGKGYDVENLESRLDSIKAQPETEDREVVYDGSTGPRTPTEYVRWGRVYINNFQKYGVFTWYDWCCQNWGTKWDACDGELIREEDKDFIRFDTAWSPPVEIADEMPRVLNECGAKDVEITWNWAEEQGYFGGVFNINSEDITDTYYENDDAAFDLCEEVMGYSQRSYAEEEDDSEMEELDGKDL